MTELECELCDGDPLGASWKWRLEKARDTVSVEILFSGPFSLYQVSSLHARVHIASDNKLWGNLIFLETTAWLSSHPGSHVVIHQAMVSLLLWGVYYLPDGAKPALSHLLPSSMKSVQQCSGFTDTASEAPLTTALSAVYEAESWSSDMSRSLDLMFVECPQGRKGHHCF